MNNNDVKVPMIVQTEFDKTALDNLLARLSALPNVGLLGMKLEVDKDLATAYAEEVFDLIEGELPVAPPFIRLVKNGANDANLSHFPSHVGSVLSWPFTQGMSGAYLLVGGAESRKSTLIAESFKPEVTLRFSEPYELFDRMEGVLHPVGLDELFSLMVLLSSQRIPFAVDSVRKFAYELNGAAGSQGIIAKLYTALTDINNFLSFMHVSIPIALNPMVKGDEAIEQVYTNMVGSVAGALYLKEGVVVKSSIRREDGRSSVRDDDFIVVNQSDAITFSTASANGKEKVDKAEPRIKRSSLVDDKGIDLDELAPDRMVPVFDDDKGRSDNNDETRTGQTIRLT